MSRTVLILFCFPISTEILIVCIGNALTIFVFWSQRSSLRRSCYLLLNLSIADLLVGVANPISFFMKTIPSVQQVKTLTFDDISIGYLLASINILCSFSSVICLSVISLERAFAMFRPFLHRTTSTKVYLCSIAFIWLSAACVTVVYALPALRVLSTMHSTMALNAVALLCLMVVCTTSIMLRFRLQTREIHQSRIMQQNIKLSKTLFVVIGLSFAFWLPGIVVNSVMVFCFECVPLELMMIGIALLLGNSIVNPVVYSCRMPMFKTALKRLLKRRRQANVELARI